MSKIKIEIKCFKLCPRFTRDQKCCFSRFWSGFRVYLRATLAGATLFLPGSKLAPRVQYQYLQFWLQYYLSLTLCPQSRRSPRARATIRGCSVSVLLRLIRIQRLRTKLQRQGMVWQKRFRIILALVLPKLPRRILNVLAANLLFFRYSDDATGRCWKEG